MQSICTQERKLIEMWNTVRAEAGMPLLKIKVRTCMKCRCQFESTGDRRCGKCKSLESNVYLEERAFDMQIALPELIETTEEDILDGEY